MHLSLGATLVAQVDAVQRAVDVVVSTRAIISQFTSGILDFGIAGFVRERCKAALKAAFSAWQAAQVRE